MNTQEHTQSVCDRAQTGRGLRGWTELRSGVYRRFRFFSLGFLGQIIALLGLETVCTVHGAIALGLERHPGRNTTLGTAYFRGAACIFTTSLNAHQQTAIGAALGFVDQSFG